MKEWEFGLWIESHSSVSGAANEQEKRLLLVVVVVILGISLEMKWMRNKIKTKNQHTLTNK